MDRQVSDESSGSGDVPDEGRTSRAVLQQLQEVRRTDAPAGETIQQMLEIGCEFLEVPYAYVAEMRESSQRIEAAEGDHPAIQPGDRTPVEETYCRHTIEADTTLTATHDVSQSEWVDERAYERVGLECYLGSEIVVDGETYGTVCFAGTDPREEPFSETERMFVDTVSLWVGSEITERRTQRQLDERQRQLEAVFEAPGTFIGVLDPDGTLVRANELAWEFADATPEAYVGRPFWAGPWFDHDESLQARVEAAVDRASDGEIVELDAIHHDPAGDPHHVAMTVSPVTDDDGQVRSIVAQGTDVTEQRQREHDLKTWQDRLQTVLDNAPVALFSYEPDGTVTLSQGRGLESFGLEPGELVGQNLFDVYEGQETLVDDLERAAGGDRHSTVRELGGVIFRTWYRPIIEDGTVSEVIAVSIDISEQQRQEQRIEAISEATSDLITADSQAAVAEIVMDLADGVLDMPLSGLWTYDADTDCLEPLAATEAVSSMLDTEDPTAALPTIEPGTVELETFETGETRVIEDYQRVENRSNPDAGLGTLIVLPLGEYGQLHVGAPEVAIPSDAEQNIMEILARNAEAALERAARQAELDAYRADLEESNERLQQFAYIASHDLQEPLRMVSSYVDLLAMEYEGQLDDEADEYIEFAVDGAERMQSMIEDLLQYSRVETKAGEFVAVDTEAVVAETRRALELAIEEESATVTVESLPSVTADRNQLGQVFQNLLDNAIQHGGDAPSITVRGFETDDHYRFEVADDGPGIPEDQREQLFKIFQQGQRDDDDSGTGIGLAVCERIVSRHGGDIWIESEMGEGSMFCFTIPKTMTDESSTTVQEGSR